MSDKGMNRGSLRRIAENNIFILLLVAVILFTVFSLLSSTFFSKYNLKTFLINLSFFVIVATGETLVLISGNLDFSIGGVIALTSVLVAKLYELGTNIYVAIVLALLVGVLTGILNGWLVVKMKLNSIIVTLGTSAITSGLAFVISNALTIAIFEDTLGFLGRGYIVRIPVPIILMAAVVIFASIVLQRSKLGFKIYASGANSRAAYISGINTDTIQFFLYIICGLGASLGGLVLTSLSAVGMPRHGVGQEIAIITAVILGGVPLGGGKGSVVGTLIGMFIMQLIYNGLTQLNVIPYYIQIIQGLLLITIVTIYVRSESISRGVKE
jgi:ribose transport system permease protein